LLLAVLIAAGFLTAGFGKAIAWIDFDSTENGFLCWLYRGYYSLNRQHLLAPLAVQLRPLWLWEMADIAAVLFELGFLLAMFRRRSMYLWLFFASGFHLINCLVLNISFFVYSICYVAFVPWAELLPRLKNVAANPAGCLGLVFSLALGIVSLKWWYPDVWDLGLNGSLIVSSVGWTVVAMLFAWNGIQEAPPISEVHEETAPGDKGIAR
jgi:hypothetical protein